MAPSPVTGRSDAVEQRGPSPPREEVRTGGKGNRRRESLVVAAADIILAEGPQAVTHRAVAARAGSSLSATTYYFTDLDDLLSAAGSRLMAQWAARAEGIAARYEGSPGGDQADLVRALCDAVLPPAGAVRGHYQQLLGAGAAPRLAQAYRAGRDRLDRAVGRILTAAGSSCPPALAIAVVDGAVVSALSEGRDVMKTASVLLSRVV